MTSTVKTVKTETPDVIRVRFQSTTVYTYHWAGGPIEIGDQVIAPPTYWCPSPRTATVVGFGRDGYDGSLLTISKKQCN